MALSDVGAQHGQLCKGIEKLAWCTCGLKELQMHEAENAKLREALQVGAAAMHGCGCNICANFYAHLDACGLNKAKEEAGYGTD